MTTLQDLATACRATVTHAKRKDPHLGRVVHEYRAVCTCGHRGKATGEPAATREAREHGGATT